MEHYRNSSRIVRLTQIQHLLHKNLDGMTTRDLAELCDTTVRTIQRDLLILQSDLHVPVINKGYSRYGILKDYILPPVSYSLYEALLLFLAARLIIRQTDENNPHLRSAIIKLASMMPKAMAMQLKQSMERVDNKPVDPDEANVFEKIAIAWGTQKRITITYQSLRSEQTKEWLVEPYFIEMTGVGYSTYVIGYAESAERKGITTFKLSRIKDIEIDKEGFEIPKGLSLDGLLGSSWGVIYGEGVNIKLKFSPVVTRRVKESVWHPSQVIEDLPDGGCILTIQAGSILEMTPWIRGWGPDVEVLEPEELRDKFCAWAKQLYGVYCPPEK